MSACTSILKALTFLVVTSFSAQAVVFDAIEEEEISDEELAERGLAFAAEVGVNHNTGNTDSTTIKTRLEANHFFDQWRNNYIFDGNFKEDDNETKEERYFGRAKTERKWSEERYTFAFISYENDRFNGLRDLVTMAGGPGYLVWRSYNASLYLEGGGGYRRNDAEDTTREFIGLFGGIFEWKISDNSMLKEEFSTEVGSENTISRSMTSLETTIIGELAMKLSVSIVHQSNPSEESDDDDDDPVESLDTRTALTLLYRF